MDELKRRMSVESDFMNYKVNDIVYSVMRVASTIKKLDGGEWIEYLPVATFNREYKKLISNFLGKGTRTVENAVNKLIEEGLVVRDTGEVIGQEEENKKSNENFYFPYDYNGAFKWVTKDMLKYLIYTRNVHCVQVYLYLLNKYEWKKDSGYNFTVSELKRMLGYSDKTRRVDELIKSILVSLKEEGIISYEYIIEQNNSGIPVHKMKLLNVQSQLAKEKKEEINLLNT